MLKEIREGESRLKKQKRIKLRLRIKNQPD
jgi:hypothetical protein